MFNSFNDLGDLVALNKKGTLVVAAAAEEAVLKALSTANQLYLEKIILVGNRQKINAISKNKNIDIQEMEIIDADNLVSACKKAVSLVRQGQADFIMKGLVDTSIFLKAVINKVDGLMIGRLLSSIMMIKIAAYPKFLILSDGGMIIDPNLEKKKGIIQNAVNFSRLLDINPIKVGCLAAKEKVNPKMPATVDAAELKKLSQQNYFGSDVIVEGPIAMDLLVSKEAARIKGYQSAVAGDVDVILMPNIETGNAIIKVMTHLGNAQLGGIVMGACVPIILTSRSDSYENKLNSIILGAFLTPKLSNCHQIREEHQEKNETIVNRK
ncbi:phosphate acyltransferase [Acetobacterium woodii]|uniref:Phosphotransacetylase Pta n=1 Tax=Acetobacterium woodii (strain ATCC 29683 / DSM 1030 / JCM 2381 / KCTC 1655 / WB1) TaxID=931626 RepID=H6LJY6_ACEWD|nr:phosphate acyltransferase [Acetobacterium woodii]AFA48740.1 phosphotransacetylase Pta [Acetobacterium woodii DSM 1030]